MTHIFGIPAAFAPSNETVQPYPPGCASRASLERTLEAMAGTTHQLPLVIGGEDVITARREALRCPHDHALELGEAAVGGAQEIDAAIVAARRAWLDWSRTDWESRAGVFLKAADLIAGPWRDRLNAATMLGQSKTVHQAEIDAAAELVDFLRFNVAYLQRIYAEQPLSPAGARNRVDYRPLEGFVYAVTPFNFTAIAGNLCCAPALMGNTVVWKPSATARLSANLIMDVLREAGLPPGVINLLHADPAEATKRILASPDFAGLHFTGSTQVFDGILSTIAGTRYRNYPRVVGETGGKNFLLAHPSADVAALTTAIVRGAFEYQGQKCSATSRLFLPRSLWSELRERLVADIATIRMGDVRDFSCFMGAVIDEKAWNRLDTAISKAHASPTESVVSGEQPNRSDGYFIPPTVVETTDLSSPFLRTEFFGPLTTAFVFEDARFADMYEAIDQGADYGLTGSVFSGDLKVIDQALDHLRYCAGNIYVNDKSTGAVVGQQPFGGARASGTNDKAGSLWNLTRWVSPRTIKENFVPVTDYRYLSMADSFTH